MKEFTTMNKLIFVLCLFFTFSAYSQTGIIHGQVIDSQTNTALSGANISIVGSSLGTTTDSKGEFFIENVPSDTVTLNFSFIGFESHKTNVIVKENFPVELFISLDPKAIPLPEVKVTSTKYEKQIRDISLPINVIQSSRIEQIMPRDVSEAVIAEPGLSITRDGIWGTHINIRGLSRNNVVMLVDGNRIDTANDLAAGLSMIDVNDVDRVEIIKGAASSLYGTGAIGGVVNILTHDGWYNEQPYVKAKLSAGYSSVNQSQQNFLQMNAGNAWFYAKLTGMTRHAENAQTPNGVLKNSQYDDNNLSTRLGFCFFENHQLKINFQRYAAKDVGIPGGNLLFPSDADVSYPEERRELYSIEYSAKTISPSLAQLSVKYFHQKILRDVENIPHIVNNVPSSPPKNINMLKVLPNAAHNMDGFQLQSDWLFSNQHLIAGLDVWQKKYEGFRQKVMRIDVLNETDRSIIKSIDQVIGERPLPSSYYRNFGFYAQHDMPLFSEKISMTIGGRYDRIETENEQTLNPVYISIDGVVNESPDNQTVLWQAHKAHDQSWSGNIGLLYHALKNTDFTLTVAKSFRSPFLEERYQYIDLGSVVKIGDPFLKPEQGMFSDIGLRYWGEKMSFIGNLFFNRINDMVVEEATTYKDRDAFVKTNIGSAELYGFDVRIDCNLFKTHKIFATTAYVYGQDNYENEPLPLVPPLNGRLGLSGSLFKLFTYEVVALIFGKQERIASWEIETPGYTSFDIYLTSKSFFLGSLRNSLYVNVENIFDRAYRNHLSTNRGFITSEPGRNISFRWQIGI